MNMLLSEAKKWWVLAVLFSAGSSAFAWLPVKAFDTVTQELIALFGLIMAGVLPTMVLTASVLRPGNFSVKKLIDYRDALRSQLVVWIGLFLVSLIASLLVIIGKMLSWSLPVTISMSWIGLESISFESVRVLNSLLVVALALVILRSVTVGNGIISLLRLSAELAISEAQAREEQRHRSAEASLNAMSERKGFGEYVELKH